MNGTLPLSTAWTPTETSAPRALDEGGRPNLESVMDDVDSQGRIVPHGDVDERRGSGFRDARLQLEERLEKLMRDSLINELLLRSKRNNWLPNKRESLKGSSFVLIIKTLNWVQENYPEMQPHKGSAITGGGPAHSQKRFTVLLGSSHFFLLAISL